MSETTNEGDQDASTEAESRAALQWRNDPPTEEGWYWLDDGQDPPFAPRCVEVHDRQPEAENALRVNDPEVVYGKTKQITDYKEAKWAGPIPEPVGAENAA